ncbi:MAG: glycoside hydrolase family 65 protein [Actinomycetales bacterium]
MNAAELAEDPLDRTRFPANEWRLVETRHEDDDLGTTETLFAVGNGYLGMRANPEEGRASAQHGTFINGFHETWDIHHAEEAFGFARTGQTIVNVPDTQTIKLYVDDEPLMLQVAELESYERSIDFADGVYRRDLIWRTPSGKRVKVSSSRMVSFIERHVVIYTFEVTMLSGFAPVVISSQLVNRQDGADEYHPVGANSADTFDPRKAGKFNHRVLVNEGEWHHGNRMMVGYRTANSGMTIGVGVDHQIETENTFDAFIRSDEDLIKQVVRVRAERDKPIRITKFAAYHTSRGVPVRELFDRCRRTLDRVREQGIDHYLVNQRSWLDRFWRHTDVRVAGHPELQQAIRWALFQLAQAAARADTLGVAAKGVTGSGYEGHYFWDTEVYVIPFLAYTNPEMARNALRFRARMLPKARARARELAMRGALFPWRTVNGEEASAYYAAGTAQFHINADVAYALMKYCEATGDEDFLYGQGVEILVETARMWADIGFWRETGPDDTREATFHIHSVTGPDEYTTVVNNNLFTNVMAKYNLAKASGVMRTFGVRRPEEYASFASRMDLTPAEIQEWAECAEGMFIPYDETLGVHPQDEHFLERELWDLENTPGELRPLLLHFHPLVIYRFQVLKQADVVLALFLQGDQFSLSEKRADFEYYDPITTGDSTLSAVVQSIIAAEVGYADMALKYFRTGLYVDLADLHQNTTDGVHIASAGGVWNALVCGFGGMRDHSGALSFDPRLPKEWTELTFSLLLLGSRLEVNLRQEEISFTCDGERGVPVSVRGHVVQVEPHSTVTVRLDGQGPRRASLTGNSPVIGAARADGSLITAGVPEFPEEHFEEEWTE